MSIDEFDPLTEDERVLAAKLGFSKRTHAPSPAVDDAIRAEARRALQSETRTPAHGIGWLKYGGVAAVCVLALGLGWKFMHAPRQQGVDAMRSSEPAAAAPANNVESPVPMPTGVAAEAAIPAATDAAPVVSPQAPAPASADAPVVPRRDPVAEALTPDAAPAPIAAKPTADAAFKAAEAAEAADAQAAQMQAKRRLAPPPAPPVDDATSARRADEAARVVLPVPSVVTADTAAERAAPASSAAVASPPPAAAARSGEIALENGYDARPPKTMDAEDAQQAWLKRIRALYQAGKKDEAAASLEAWRKRYPQSTVPPDLAPLGKVTPEK